MPQVNSLAPRPISHLLGRLGIYPGKKIKVHVYLCAPPGGGALKVEAIVPSIISPLHAPGRHWTPKSPTPPSLSLSDSISPPPFYLSISHLNFLLRFITLIFSSFRAPDYLAAVDPSSLAAADISSNAAANASMEAKDDDIIEGKATDIISPEDDLSETVTENPADASDENIRFVTEMAFTLTENENLD